LRVGRVCDSPGTLSPAIKLIPFGKKKLIPYEKELILHGKGLITYGKQFIPSGKQN